MLISYAQWPKVTSTGVAVDIISFSSLSISSSNLFASLQCKKINCIPQHYVKVFSTISMLDLNIAIVCAMSVWATRLHWLYWIVQAPILFCTPSLLWKSAYGSGERKPCCIPGEFDLLFLLRPSYWNACALDQVETNACHITWEWC